MTSPALPPAADVVPWSAGTWSTPPVAAVEDGSDLLVTAAEKSDAWRHTSYGFVRDDAHALLAPMPTDSALEVTFDVDYTEAYDQAGLMLRVDPENWLKAGVENSDGAPQVGAVVTLGHSDWSVRPVPEWAGRTVTVRASRAGDAVTLRTRVDDGPFELLRLAYLPPSAEVTAGPYLCAPSRAGLTVRFRRWATGPADTTLH